jgi:hypothetical protein
VAVLRTGGGYGAVMVNYTLKHLGSSPADVTPTAHYTSSQTLGFAGGVVQVGRWGWGGGCGWGLWSRWV